jgi:hypothetical protein
MNFFMDAGKYGTKKIRRFSGPKKQKLFLEPAGGF